MLERLTTEARNPASERLDSLSALEIVNLMNAEDATIATAVGREKTAIATAIDRIVERLRSGGRLLYIGSGTSGRLGVLDAAECPPTFNTNPAQVVGIIAGGYDALVRSIEGAEDVPDLAITDLIENNLSAQDVLVGIATSGRTPYVVKGLEYARKVGAYAIGLSCNDASELVAAADLMITPVVGPEILSGSTRMKAGTATKMVLNMLTTGTMVRLGKTYGNLMVDLRATNNKLSDRSRRIVKTVTGLSDEESQQLLDHCDGEVKTAIVAHKSCCSAVEARKCLESNGGHLRRALEEQA
jgi:N-acetylmuramic acid 6-phosphate etherase